MIHNITFLNFKTIDDYLKLQNRFARYDERQNPIDDSYNEVVKQDFKNGGGYRWRL